MAKAKFTPFPVPRDVDDTPLVTPHGGQYRCSGCGGPVPAGAWLFEAVEDGMVVGLLARLAGATGVNPHAYHSAVDHADGEVVHACGTAADACGACGKVDD